MTKTRKLIILLLVVLCAATFSGSVFCYARYVFERGNQGTISPGSDLPVSVANGVVVDSQETLFNALESGYPYITLGDNISNPLIVTQETMDVKKSLILDLNGKELQRIGENAMLNVGPNVTLTIVDTSEGQKGSLYNPVGTVLDVYGGTLDVRAGKFESGPRTWEYLSNQEIKDKIATSTSTDNLQPVQYTATKGAEPETVNMPIITPTVVRDASNNPTSVDGNIYFDIAYNGGVKAIPADTYCYYNTSDNFTSGATVPFDSTVADFAYSYYAYPSSDSTNAYGYLWDTEEGAKAVLGNTNAVLNKDYVFVTVYGFNNVIQTAMGFPNGYKVAKPDTPDTDLGIGQTDPAAAPYYAAVKMSDGKVSVNCEGKNENLKAPLHTYENGKRVEKSPDLKNDAGTGSFISYFGVETTACVYFSGGTTSIKTNGAFATVDPKVIKEDIGSENAFSSEGRGICVYGGTHGGGGGGTLDIDGGQFYAYNHNIIRMEQGRIDIDGDSKSALQLFKVHRVSFYSGYQSSWSLTKADEVHPSGKGGIFSSGGTIDLGVARLYMTSGRIPEKETVEGATSTLHTYTSKQGVYGVYSNGGTVNMKNVDIYIRGQGSAGVSVNNGGQVNLDGSTPTEIGEDPELIAQRETVYKDFSQEVRDDIQYLYQSNIFVIGYNTKGVLVQSGEGSSVSSVTARNTAIFVSRAQGAALPTTFLAGIDVINGNGSFSNCRIQSDGYGITMTRGQLALNGSRLSAYNASAVILGGGNMVINDSNAGVRMDTTTIHCKLTQDYIKLAKGKDFTGTLHTAEESKKLLYTYAGIDIIGGKLLVPSGTLDYTFDSDKETPETINRIDQTLFDNHIYEPYGSGVQCMAPNGFLPAESTAVRVIGAGAAGSDIGTISLENALEITASCTVTSNMGGGITIRGGSVVLGKNDEEITVQTLVDSDNEMNSIAYGSTYYFANKTDNWHYRDNRRGGDAMYISGGSVTANTSKLTLIAEHGNGLLVTGSGCIKKYYENYKGQPFNDYLYTFDSTVANINPEVTINCGVFEGRCDGFAKNDINSSFKPGLVSDFNFTGPSSYYGVKVVCGGKLNVNGGSISGYGGICTMGAIIADPDDPDSIEKNKAHLNLTADYDVAANRITVSSVGADAGGFYNNSIVGIKSVDKSEAKVKVATQDALAAPETLTDFGLIVTGKNTCFVIEKYGESGKGGGSTVTVDGGFYCATQGDENGGKAFWCDNGKGTLMIKNGWFIGNMAGGAIQTINLASCVLEGGCFINDCAWRGANHDGTEVFTGAGGRPDLAAGKKLYQLNTEGTYYTQTETSGSASNSAVYVKNAPASA